MKHIIDDADKNKYEAYTKQETLAAIQEAISSGELPEEINGLVLTFKNPIDNKGYKIAFCTQAKYNELEAGGQLEADCLYIITDDSTYDDLAELVDQIGSDLDNLEDSVGRLANNLDDLEETVGNLGEFVTALDQKVDALPNSKVEIFDSFNNDDYIYDYSQSPYPRVALDLLPGKTPDDTLGISGSLEVKFRNSSVKYRVYFSQLWNDESYVKTNFYADKVIDGAVVTLALEIGIDSNKNLYQNGEPRVYNASALSLGNIETIRPYYIKVYFK